MEGLIVLLLLAVLAVPILLIVALVKLSTLGQRVEALEREFRAGQASAARPEAAPAVSAAASVGAAPSAERGVEVAWRDRAPGPQPGEGQDPLAQARSMQPQSETAAQLPAGPSSSDAPQASATPAAPSIGPPPLPTPAETAPSAPAAPVPSTPAAPTPPAPPGFDPITVAIDAVRRWFTEGNVPVKVGMLVLFAGVAALLRYATDQGWMRFPIELRLAGIALFALAGLGFGWRQRERRPAFALSLQGGAIGLLLMTVFAAFRLYALLPATAALGLSVVLVAASGVLAVLQHSRALAVLGILAGFLAPLLMSTGGGNHVALFSYYAVLNAGIFAIAWYRPWRVLNVLGFVFTYAIGSYWGVLDYQPDKLASTLPFLALFFVFYLLIPILYAKRLPAQRRDLVDGALVFGNPLFSFLLLSGLLQGERLPLAFAAIGIAAIYAALGWGLLRHARYRPLAQAHAVLAVGFATLAVPLALSARVTASVFALEGAALIWLGLRQQQRLSVWAGVGLQGLAALAYLFGASLAYPQEQALANPGFIGALVLALAGFASAWSWRAAGRDGPALAMYLWGLMWWGLMAGLEIQRFVPVEDQADAWLGFIALSLGLLALALRRVPAAALGWSVAAGVAAALPLALQQSVDHLHPFAGYGLLAWLGFAVLGAVALRQLREQPGSIAAWAHSAWLLAWPLALCLWLRWLTVHAELAEGWRLAATGLPWLLVAGGVLWRPLWLGWPLADRFAEWRPVALQGALFIVGSIWLLLITRAGGAAPLPWLPLLNPLELSLLACLGLALALQRSDAVTAESRAAVAWLLGMAAFVTVTVITLRSVHQLGGVPWQGSALFDSALAQASLSLVWSVLGVAGWLLGSRRQLHGLWQAGAVLMGIVLLKLILVDRQHLGDLLGIASFIGYGLLCTAVGYFAPAPPRAGPAPETPAPERPV
ncbi:MAG: DUF2339 domain-containing protein [Aquimonas sp.]|nr:DUF2339 domain-containing protein [Aquimonas sp.]